MIIISVWCPKGGVGKSTISMNLASAFCATGKSVLICDIDTVQHSCYDLFEQRNVSWRCVKEMPSDKPVEDVVIIDHPPSHDKVPKGAFVLLPFSSSAIDFKSMKKSTNLLSGKKYIPIVNRVDFRNREEREIAKHFEEQGAFILKQRSIFRRCYGENKTVFEMERKYGATDARKDLNKLMRLITNE